MADPEGNSGIRAEVGRPLAMLRKDNYRAWASKLKAQLKVMDCWRFVSGAEVEPSATLPAGTSGTAVTAAALIRTGWMRRRDRAAAVLITSISDEELHTVLAVEDDPIRIWTRLREKFERRSEAEAETAQMNLLDFAHREGENSNAMIDRFETIVMVCLDQGVAVDENLQKRMLLARPADRYSFLKQSYLLAPIANRPDLVGLKAQIRDIDSEFQKSNSVSEVNKSGQANRAEAEAAWSHGSSTGTARSSDRGSGRFSGRGGRGNGGRGRGEDAGSKDVTCYCCGQKGHIKPNCAKRDEECHKCGKVGHLQTMCNDASERANGSTKGGDAKKYPEASQFETYESFACEVTIGEEQPEEMIVEVGLVGESEFPDDKWLGDSGSSHHIKSTRDGMFNVEPCPPGTRIRQVHGFVGVKEWGTVLLEVDGEHGKHVIQLRETLIVPSINVNLFSLQRVIKGGFLPVYGEVEGKCLIKKRAASGDLVQVATMTVINGRSTLDCKLVDDMSNNSSSGAALLTRDTGGFNVKTEPNMEVVEVEGFYLDEEPTCVEDLPPPHDDDADGGGIVPVGGGQDATDGSASPGGVSPGGASPGGVSPGGASPGGGSPGGASPEGEILRELDMVGCKAASTPLEPGVKLSVVDSPDDDQGKARMEAYLYRKGVSKDLWGKRVGSDSLSSCETEYMGLTLAAQEASYLGDLKGEMYASGGVVKAKCIDMRTDSQSAKSLAENPVYHGRSKHIRAKWHFIRRRVEMGMVRLVDVRTELMGADMMTKSVGPAVLGVDRKLIGMQICG